MGTITVRAIGIRVTAVVHRATNDSLNIARSANAKIQQRKRPVALAEAPVEQNNISGTSDATMKIITVDVDGTMAIVVALRVTNDSSTIAQPGNVWIPRRRRRQRKSAALIPVKHQSGKATNVVTMGITIIVATGTAVTVAGLAVTRTSSVIVRNVIAKTPRSKRASVLRQTNVVRPSSMAMAVVTTKTTAATGTMVTAAGRIMTNFNFRTAKPASV